MRRANRLELSLVRAVANRLSGRGRDASLVVLIYHRVLAEPDPLQPDEPDSQEFASQLDLLRSVFNLLPLTEGLRRLRHGDLPPRSASITFDDGYANNCEVALPILLQRGVPATVFVAPGFLNGGRMFNDTIIETVRKASRRLDLTPLGLGRYAVADAVSRRAAIASILDKLKFLEPADRQTRVEQICAICDGSLPADLMMTSTQVRKLHRSGIEIGAHTMTHPILTSTRDDQAREEIEESKKVLEEMIGATVESFAYPNGRPLRDYDHRHVAMVRDAGFEFAVSTAWGAAVPGSDPFQIPRAAAWDRTPFRHGLRLARVFGQRNFLVA